MFYYEQYDFDITNAKKPDDRDEMYSRVLTDADLNVIKN